MSDPVKPDGEKPPAAPPAKPNDGATPPAPDAMKLIEEQSKQIADLSAKLEAVTKESIERRQKLKPLESLEESLRKALQIPEGQTSKAVEDAMATQQAKMKQALIKGKALGLAGTAGSVDPELAVAAMDLSKVEVDLDSLTVKDEIIRSEVERLRKAKPFLFPSTPAPAVVPPAPGTPTPTPPRPPAGGGDGATPGEEYVRLLNAGKKDEAMQVYLKNRKAVGEYLLQHRRPTAS